MNRYRPRPRDHAAMSPERPDSDEDERMDEAAKLRQLVNGYRLSQAIHVAAVLGLSDLLADGPRTVDDLAGRSGGHPRTLYRLLRALGAAGVYEELDGARFRSTALGDALRSDAPSRFAAGPRSSGARTTGRPGARCSTVYGRGRTPSGPCTAWTCGRTARPIRRRAPSSTRR